MTTKTYDNLNRLTSIVSATNGVAVASYGYQMNHANQRTSITNLDSSRWVYQYDELGQVTSGKKYWSDGTPVAGQQFGYAFDDIGNRTTTSAGGNEFGADFRYANYTANSLNQYTSRTVPNAVDIIGTASANATVTVNNEPTYRKGTYYWKELSIDNSLTPVWQSITNLAVLNDGNNPDILTNHTGKLFLPTSPEPFLYDADGNLISDGRWTNHWDAENRLISMESLTNGPAGSKLKLLFGYDYQSRRISKTVSNWTGSAWALVSDQRFIYDGWNLQATLTPGLSLESTFMWGLDLSGSLQGAGGVGGLLLVKHHSSPVTSSFTCYDGNGNVMTMIDAGAGTITGQYEYGPFGETIQIIGTSASANPCRFSTKFTDSETDLCYYGYRYYSPNTGRWLSRDPIQEKGGLNAYGIVNNDLIQNSDYLGLFNLIWREGLTKDRRVVIEKILNNLMLDKLPTWIDGFKSELAELSGKMFYSTCCEDELYKKKLEKLISTLEKLRGGLKSNRNLYVYSIPIANTTVYAEWDSAGILGHNITLQDQSGGTKFWDRSPEKKLEDLFHELTHIYGTDDEDTPFENDAHFIDDLAFKPVKALADTLRGKAEIECKDLRRKQSKKQ